MPTALTPAERRLAVRPKEALPLLQVTDLHVEFVTRGKTIHAVRGVDLTIEAGAAVGLVGESGSGKSVSAMALLRLLPPRTARVRAAGMWFEGTDLRRLSDAELQSLRGSRIAMIFQDPLASLNPLLPIGRQISETLTAHRRAEASKASQRAAELLDLVGIANARKRLGTYPHELSGGMRQRVMIAMALACEPALLIADEPTTALDVTVQAQIMDLLSRLRVELGMAVLLISHDIGVVGDFASRIVVMYSGQVVETGPTRAILDGPRHPYTLGLLRSIPRLDDPRRGALPAIEGLPPDSSIDLQGCPFRPRCPSAIDICVSSNPSLEPLPGGRAVACWVKPAESPRSSLASV
jgi:oligopeptide/dipeptide ABC transporter ATP-binding protein